MAFLSKGRWPFPTWRLAGSPDSPHAVPSTLSILKVGLQFGGEALPVRTPASVRSQQASAGPQLWGAGLPQLTPTERWVGEQPREPREFPEQPRTIKANRAALPRGADPTAWGPGDSTVSRAPPVARGNSEEGIHSCFLREFSENPSSCQNILLL